MRTREMAEGDAPAVARLCAELGYPASEERILGRCRALEGDEDHALLVAEDGAGAVVGWVHAHAPRLLLADSEAEVLGLVVDEARRGGGIGRLLMAAAERWAMGRGCREVRLRSAVGRKDAHRFYEGLGYGVRATSLVLGKTLEGAGSDDP
jgi:GNAT superfamily N-acetyltransferase